MKNVFFLASITFTFVLLSLNLNAQSCTKAAEKCKVKMEQSETYCPPGCEQFCATNPACKPLCKPANTAEAKKAEPSVKAVKVGQKLTENKTTASSCQKTCCSKAKTDKSL